MARVSNERALWLARHILPLEPGLRAWLAKRRVADLDIDDIVQEAYAKLAALESVDEVRNPRAYLFQTAHSIIFSHLRRSQVVSIRAVEDVELWRFESEDASPERRVSDREELHRVLAIVGALPQKAAAVFTLRRIEGLSQKETADRLKISESTVEKHMAKSLRVFMDALGRSGISPPHASKGADVESSQPHVSPRNERPD